MTITLHFHGAARMVTGSCYLLETATARVLVDCGMFQGSRTQRDLNERALPFEASTVHSLLLTHAHIDHTGLVPKLVRAGFRGSILATEATEDLCSVMLPDSAHIQESDLRWKNDRNRKRGLPPAEPIYTMDDVGQAMKLFQPVTYGDWRTAAEGIRARWWNAGHLLGSASIELEVDQAGAAPLRILFSGDIGPDAKMLEPDPQGPAGVDYVICESTYGGRDRVERTAAARLDVLAEIVTQAAARHGALLIPSFAVERSQEVVTDLVRLMDTGRIPQAPIFLDSPLAQKATAIFARYSRLLEDGDALYHAFRSPHVRYTESAEDSKAIARLSGFHIIIAASGMCDAGRIRHHLKNHLWRSNATVLLVGYQAAGSLGAILAKGTEKTVKIMGEDIEVRATVRRFDSYSGHADGPELVHWVKSRMPVARGIFLTHGEETAQLALEQDLAGPSVAPDLIQRPALDSAWELSGPKATMTSSGTSPRINPATAGKPDWNNEFVKLTLELQRRIDKSPDSKTKAALVARLREALAQADDAPGGNE